LASGRRLRTIAASARLRTCAFCKGALTSAGCGDRRLVDVDDLVDMLQALDTVVVAAPSLALLSLRAIAL